MGLFSKLKPVFCVLLFRMLMLGKIMLIIFSNFQRETQLAAIWLSVTFNVRLRLLMFVFFYIAFMLSEW